LQENIFKTDRMQLLIVMGIFLLALARRSRTLMILLATPAYYLLVQSVFHTEYRYTLAIHPFLFVMAAVALYCVAVAVGQGARSAYKLVTRNRADWSSGRAA